MKDLLLNKPHMESLKTDIKIHKQKARHNAWSF